MKKLFLRILTIGLLTFAASLVLHYHVYPLFKLTTWSWGSPIIHQKRLYLDRHPDDFNMVVIGSSRVYRQIDPSILDTEIVADTSVKAFNFGVNWLFAPESFYIFDHLKKDHPNLKYAIIELSKIKSIDYPNLHTTRIKYWYNFDRITFALKAISTSVFSFPEKLATSVAHLISYFDKLINLGYVTEAVDFNSNHMYSDKYDELGPDLNGFKPYADVDPSKIVTEPGEDQMWNVRFHNDTSVVTRRKEISAMQFAKFESNPELLQTYNTNYVHHLKEMISQAKSQGIHLIFLISPRVDKNQYNEIIPVFNQLPPSNRIEISDSRDYPELYLARYSTDETHLNKSGSVIYTKILARKINDILQAR